MRVIFVILILLLNCTSTLYGQSYLSNAAKESGYIIKIISGDSYEEHFFLKDTNSLVFSINKSDDWNKNFDDFLEVNKFTRINTVFTHKDLFYCCILGITRFNSQFDDSIQIRAKLDSLLYNKSKIDSITQRIDIEYTKIRWDNDDPPSSLGNYYTTFSYKWSKVVLYFYICKSTIYHCSCPVDLRFDNVGKIAIVKFENTEKLSEEEIKKFDTFFKKALKVRKFKPIKSPPIEFR